jgi:glycosyltransferase involved in cell wall biosynthesis
MVLLEAMSFSLPCVSFDCPSGPADIIIQNKTGLLGDNGNISQLVQAISTLIENENLRNEMGTNAFDVVDQYNPDLIFKRWENLFNQ